MEGKRLSYGESRFLDVIWENEPVPSGRLVELCREKLGWKKSTTYTRLRILAEKGYVKNEESVVTALVSRTEVQASESAYVVEQTFSGSLPGFLVSFLGGKTISAQEAEELKKLIDEHRED
ncbi:MAG: BlaI/MecI/CopY family transcriptional regulator [Oscillospiraceae bacterium]|nr:BlaI/MecI/CopY family transcriptional regulator [Oscillospiraceae bacterium]